MEFALIQPTKVTPKYAPQQNQKDNDHQRCSTYSRMEQLAILEYKSTLCAGGCTEIQLNFIPS